MTLPVPTVWTPQEGSGTVTTLNDGIIRTEQNTVQRREQDGTLRVLQPNIVTTSNPTIWTEESQA